MTFHMLPRPIFFASALPWLALTTASLAQSPLADGVLIPGSIDRPEDLASADIDGDGVVDLVLAGEGGPTYWLRGLGAQEFDQAEVLFESVGSTTALLAVDLDADGDIEILRGTLFGYELWTLTASGDYAQVSNPPPFGSNSQVMDVDGDGVLDLVSPTSWYRGMGGLAFVSSELVLGGSSRGTGVALADFDQDGNLDLLLSQSGAALPHIAVYPGTGSLPFDPSTAIPINAQGFSGSAPVNIALLDGDLDGDLDFALGSYFTVGTLVYIENLGSLAFGPEVAIGTDHTARTVLSGDYDGDGQGDLITVSSRPSSSIYVVQTFRGLGGGSFGPANEVTGASSATRLLALDADGDGADEFISVGSSSSVDFFDHAAADDFSRQPLNEALTVVAVVDVDQDSRMDLVALAIAPTRIVWKKRMVDGSYGRVLEVVGQDTGQLPSLSAVTAGDMDGDGLVDLVTLRGSLTPTVVLSRGLPGGGFAAPAPTADVTLGTFFGVDRVLVADVDQDQDLDIFIIGSSGGVVIIIPNLGGGSFGVPYYGSPSQSNVDAPLIVDIDGDGLLDIAHPFTSDVQWRRGLPGGTFAPRATLFGSGVQSLAFADRTGDGFPDLVATSSLGDGGSIIRANAIGAGQFTGSSTLVSNANAISVSLVDLSLNGTPDIVATAASPDLLRVWLGPSSFGGLGPEITPDLPSDWSASSIASVLPLDIDGDGDLDLVLNPRQSGGGFHGIVIVENVTFDEIGVPYCGPGVPNSTGVAGELGAFGAASISRNQVELMGTSLPPGATGFFLTSLTTGFATGIPNSVGNLCIGGEIGRFVGPGQIGTVDASGTFSLELDLGAFPSPSQGLIPVQSGQTWNFQAWHRDSVQGQATSNFTTGLALTFL